jgi:hypothetical protein
VNLDKHFQMSRGLRHGNHLLRKFLVDGRLIDSYSRHISPFGKSPIFFDYPEGRPLAKLLIVFPKYT